MPITDVREITRLAYAFKASKALLCAVDMGLFGQLSGKAKSVQDLATALGVKPGRMETLLTALVSLGLLAKAEDGYSNAPACEEYLVPGKRSYFGDYFRLQTDKLIYPAYDHLAGLLRTGQTPAAWREYQGLMQDAREAEQFSRGQHSGSLGPAIALAKKLDLSGRSALLDVGGGSGAFTIMLCKSNSRLRSTILDFPNALSVARQYVEHAGLVERVRYEAGDALDIAWPAGHDVVLMSYLLSAVDAGVIGRLLERAFGSLAPGGMLVLHDFMVDDDKCGPRDAALWFLTCLYNAPDAELLTPAGLTRHIVQAGFVDATVWELIPGLTRVAQGYKPLAR